MTSLPRAFAAGIGLGIIEQLLLWNTSQAGLVEVVLFVIIVVALALQGPLGGRSEEKGSWAAVLPSRPLAPAVRQLRVVRWTPPAVGVVLLAGGLALPLLLTNAPAATLIGIMGFAIVGLSVGLVTGLGGQLTPRAVRHRCHRRGRLVPGLVAHRVVPAGLRVRRAGRRRRVGAHRPARAARPRPAPHGDDAVVRRDGAGVAPRPDVDVRRRRRPRPTRHRRPRPRHRPGLLLRDPRRARASPSCSASTSAGRVWPGSCWPCATTRTTPAPSPSRPAW